MADSTTNIDTVSDSDVSKAVKVSALVDAASPSTIFGRRASTTSALTWGYYGGKYRKADGTIVTKANATIALTDAATNYLLETDGTVSKVTAAPTDWPGPLASGAKALYQIVCSGGAVTSYTDYRTAGIGSGSVASVVAADVGITDAGTYFTGTDVEAALQEVGASLAALGGAPVQCIPIACSDETTALTTGTAKVTFRMPYAFTLTAVRASVTTAPTGATLLTVDINESGTTILSTKLTFDASEKTTTTAATPAVISDASLADDAEITIDIDDVGSTIAGAGLKVYLIGTKT